MKFDMLFILDIDKLSLGNVKKEDARMAPVFHVTFSNTNDCTSDNEDKLEKISDVLSRQISHEYETGDIDFSYSDRLINDISQGLKDFDYEYYVCDDSHSMDSSSFYVLDFNNNNYMHLLEKDIESGRYNCKTIYDTNIIDSLKKETGQFKSINPDDLFVGRCKLS